MQPRVRKLTIIVLCLFLFSFIPIQAVQAYIPSPITTSVTWTTDQTLDGDLDINDGGHLTIAPGVTITFTCAADEMNPYYINVWGGGQLTADGVTFQGDGTAGCWGGFLIMSGDYQTVIEDSVIRDVSGGITIVNSSPTISGNEIYNIKAPDDTDPGEDGYIAIGIDIMSIGLLTTPIIQNNNIHHITGGAGADGVDGVDATESGAAGEDGGAGGDGGWVYGIRVDSQNTYPLIQGNTIAYLTGGACGAGGDGGNGAAGADAEVGYSNGENGGGGGNGGDGGLPGLVYGIYAGDTANTRIIDNEIAYLTQSAACSGGDGGAGADGGQGREGGTGGYGGRGGNGGQGGTASYDDLFGVTGIHIEHAEGEAVTHDTISGNSIHDLTATDSGMSGSGGNGGRSGDGGDGDPNATSGAAAGGTSNDAGGGGDANNVGDGLFAAGIRINNVGLTIESNTIYNLEAGDGQTGGNGGNGGTGGDGGTGGYNFVDRTYGNGGDGGEGGNPGNACQGGAGGYAYGIYVLGEETIFFETDVFNNDIWAVYGGEGGDGSTPGLGGNGGNGGDTLDLSEGTGGNGGDGYQGGYGWSGGRAGYGYLVALLYASGDVYNNTLVDVTSPEIGGAPSLATPGGTGGLGGNGATPGAPGTDGAVGGWDGETGAGARAFGILKVYGSEGSNIYNNILYLTDSTPENTFAVATDDTSVFLDYNTVFGWEEPVMGATHGPNIIEADPLFVSATDHNLQSGSLCIDAGTNTGAPSEDILGYTRPADGDGNGTATVDIGAFEVEASELLNYLPLLLK